KAYGAGDLSTISITYDEVQPEALDLAKVFEEYCTQPVDAVLDEETYVASKETLGYGFVPEEVQLQLDALPEGGSLEVEYQILVPEHTKASLEADLFKDVLSHSETEHTWNNNRTNNLILACEAIDGYILKPGATFSFNEVVGERTEAKGYREATVFAGMESKPEVGGGVCQVASTLYVCTLYADLEVVERAVHTFEVSYVPLGLDATVYWGSLDYKFRNNTDYPIRIDASVHDGVVDISFVGTETKDYYIEMRTEITSTTPWKTVEKEITDGSYEDGETITSPYTGYTAKSYKQKWDRATETMISEEFEADSRYTVRDKVVAVVPKTTTPTSPPATDPPETDPTETDPPETDPPETDPPETDPGED
ncbi:MAG: VanW family protein, partial [Firmicutes bacterium]|nr:VanW family protein [Bacillota bacterium]